MQTTRQTDTVRFTANGAVTIPIWLLNEVGVVDGTRALVYRDGDTIVLKPITASFIRNLRGSLKGSGVLKPLMDERKRDRKLG